MKINNKGKVVSIIGVAAILASSVFSCASENQHPDAVLKAAFPKLKVDSIGPSAVKGLYEVITGGNILYFDAAGKHIVFGEIWSSTGENLTAKARNKITAMKYKLFKEHLSDAVKIGSGKHEVIEIIDPDCPFCRRMGDYWSKRNDVTRYVFFFPLKQIHPKAEAHSNYVMSSSSPAKALAEIESGKYDAAEVPQLTPSPRITVQTELVAKSGIGGTPAYYVNGAFVNGANIAAIEKLIGKE